MKTLKITIIGLIAAGFAFAQQNTLVETTLSAATTSNQTTITVASATGINAPAVGVPGSSLYIVEPGQTVGENMVVTGVSSTTISVRRGQNNTRAVAHTSGAKVWVATAPNWFKTSDPVGSCTLSATETTPWLNIQNGRQWKCESVTGGWIPNDDYSFYVPPTACTWVPTTLTQTSTYTYVGASSVFVLKGISNAAAGTMTLTCNIAIPTRVTATRGAVLKDITLLIASSGSNSGVVPTSVGTSTLGSITFPTPSTTETASTVTPVAIGGTVTTVSPTAFLSAVSTDGAFFTFKHTYSTAVTLSTDYQILQYTMPILQSAASVSNLFTPGLIVHYTAPAL